MDALLEEVIWDRVTRPEVLMTACINAMRVLTDPAETGAVCIALPQDVEGEAWDYPDYFWKTASASEYLTPPPKIISGRSAFAMALTASSIARSDGLMRSM